jgi:2-methylaconitate cis-trans-isomerase PrpF
VPPVAPVTTVRLFNLNRSETVVAEVPVADGLPCEEGDFRLDGVAFAGAGITLAFLGEPGRRLLPTGRACDRLLLPDGTSVEATLIDAGNPTVFVDATALGLRGDERPAAFVDARTLARLEHVRAAGAVAMGLAADAAHATRERPATPKLAWIAAPADFEAADGRRIAADEIDLRGRILSMGALHHAFTGTGAVAAGAAAALPGSVLSRRLGRTTLRLRLGHPSGVMHVGADLDPTGDEWRLLRATVQRSARLLMSGTLFVPWQDPS